MKKILLVYPETPQDSYWSFSHALKMIGKKVNMPPLGLLTIGAMLPSNEFELRLVDMNVAALTDDDIQWADYVFVSAMIVQRESLEETLARAKRLDRPTIAGGPYTSTAYRETANVDCFVIGEAEGIWDAFLADLRIGTVKKAYAAPVREDERRAIRDYFGDDVMMAPADAYPDINLAPVPRFDLLNFNDYASMPVQASRGCPVGCEFCDIWRRFGRKSRNKTPERIRAELDELYRLGWRDAVFLVDDNFIGHKGRALEILHELAAWQEKRGWPFAFLTEATLSVADDDEILGLMARSGFTSVFVGIETPCEESLKETRKYINTIGSMADKVAKIQSAGIQLMSGFIIGFDKDPDNIANKMTRCIQEMGIPQAMIGLLTALPDTDLHDRLTAENRIRSQTTGNNTHGFAVNFETARPESAVLEDYRQVLRAAYPRDMSAFFERCEVLRDRWPRHPEVNPGFMPFTTKVRALVNCFWAAARSEYRYNAFGFLLSTLLKKPTFFEQAVTLCVKAHHLWAITGQAFEADAMRASMRVRLGEFAEYLRQTVPELTASAGGLSRSVLHDIEAYRVRIVRETEREFKRLSRDTRQVLSGEWDRFIGEANALYARVTGEAEAVKVRY